MHDPQVGPGAIHHQWPNGCFQCRMLFIFLQRILVVICLKSGFTCIFNVIEIHCEKLVPVKVRGSRRMGRENHLLLYLCELANEIPSQRERTLLPFQVYQVICMNGCSDEISPSLCLPYT